MPAKIPAKEHRGSKNPRSTMRKNEFSQLTRIQKRLEKRLETIEFDQEQLSEVSIVQGSPFDIDQDDPIDVDPRYFLPGPVEDMEHGLEVLRTTLDYWGTRPEREWPQAEPIENHLLRSGHESDLKFVARNAWWDAQARAHFCELAAYEAPSGWTRHGFMPLAKRPWCIESRPSPDDGRPCWQMWSSDKYYAWHRPPGNYPFNPRALHYNCDVPHAAGTVQDMARPLRQGLLRSELLMAVSLLKAQIRWTHMYIDHYVYPVLVVSFHGRYSARILQAYFQNGKIVVRPSRLINLHTRTISSEVRLVIRWLISRPVGDTRVPLLALEEFDDKAAMGFEASGTPEVLAPTMQVR
ncbi:hypothetical protein AK830_g8752 [Neonectria ditissima]|uniref:Uncharacterized protein n=1 Tax=Neonectria ditissima TaxID=78410 RepID=A0A0P7AT99_9HYPO|nr:hypothetical protein AK830_g8752 [Neonectria ditissima]